MKRVVLMITVMAAAVALASGVALAETFRGTDGHDEYYGTTDADKVHGKGGDDLLLGDRGDDAIRGGSGGDVIGAYHGDDTVYGGSGKDKVNGGDGADEVYAGSGDDIVEQGRDGEKDRINCGPGFDRYYEGDRFDRVSASCEKRLQGPPFSPDFSYCEDWYAWHDSMPGTPPTLHVKGECTFPTGGYSVELEKDRSRSDEDRLVLNLIVREPPDGVAVTTALEHKTVRYDEDIDHAYETVTILPDGVSIPVQEVS